MLFYRASGRVLTSETTVYKLYNGRGTRRWKVLRAASENDSHVVLPMRHCDSNCRTGCVSKSHCRQVSSIEMNVNINTHIKKKKGKFSLGREETLLTCVCVCVCLRVCLCAFCVSACL